LFRSGLVEIPNAFAFFLFFLSQLFLLIVALFKGFSWCFENKNCPFLFRDSLSNSHGLFFIHFPY
ncbi:hypothetical protein, partial [Brevibacillus panacihumi]